MSSDCTEAMRYIANDAYESKRREKVGMSGCMWRFARVVVGCRHYCKPVQVVRLVDQRRDLPSVALVQELPKALSLRTL